MSAIAKLRFIHLSDIHFNNRAASYGFDPDRELRRAVERDIAEMRVQLGNADAILISGDIAYAGKREEFEDAAEWLGDICTAAGCGPEAVFMCPGNHDVDQSVIRDNPLIQDGHDAIRRENTHYERDTALTRRLVQPGVRALFYSPIAAYNEFAARYQSSFFADSKTFVWEHDFTLNDSSTLRLRGLNTALLSGLADQERSLFLGSRAWTLPIHSGVEYMVMAHHPPSWLADGRETERAFENVARIQLFGHEHDQRIMPGRDWVKLFAGAINPHRAESGWRPGYNILEVYVDPIPDRRLKVEVHAREWQGAPAQFRSIEDIRHDSVHRTEIKLPDLPEAMRTMAFLPAISCPSLVMSEAKGELEAKSVDPQQRFRIAVFRFFRLSLSKKNEIVGHLRLSEESDSRLTDVERFKLSLLRAREREQMDAIEALMDKLEND
ncbi:MAG: metallophosphoesterase [Fluviicoccus sp.]|uniref:metallophosphoesterase n=1 Tax=Fluviicoccus sp. TaxID=2003552 RepID=UPI0027191BD2|nr:metallophosphoesterase [Fluviicoccus sp.]MDO8329805.1 metallophosphoesterase [Fluviicoccus sp.]